MGNSGSEEKKSRQNSVSENLRSSQRNKSGSEYRQSSQRAKTPNGKENGTENALSESKPLLSSYQKSILLKSWNHHSYRHNHNENIGVKIYLKLFDKCPEVKQIFGFEKLDTSQLVFNEKFIKQAKTFITVTDNALKNLEHLDSNVKPSLFALGGRHTRLVDRGFKLQHWDVFAESMLECIIESQGMHRHRDTCTIWRLFISWMITIMKDGYYDSLKNQRQLALSPAEAASDGSNENP